MTFGKVRLKLLRSQVDGVKAKTPGGLGLKLTSQVVRNSIVK